MRVKKLKEFLDSHRVKYVSIIHSRAYTTQEIAAFAHVPGRAGEGSDGQSGRSPCKRCKPNQPPLAEQHAATVAELCRVIANAEQVPSFAALWAWWKRLDVGSTCRWMCAELRSSNAFGKQIPTGETVSYADIANRIGATKSVKAVAQACAANALAVAIPCHRVVRNDGGLSGCRWVVERKRALLERRHTLERTD